MKLEKHVRTGVLEMEKYDVIIIGGGVVGAAVIDRLAKYELRCLLLEAGSDVAYGSSRANSGIIHAGYDAETGTLKARFNREGNRALWNIARELDVPHIKTGSLVVGTAEQLPMLQKLKARGDLNGVVTEIIGRAEILKKERNVADGIEYALYAQEAGVISPYKLTIGYADRAVTNGAVIKLNSAVTAVFGRRGNFRVHCADGAQYAADTVVNAAGAGAAEINRIAGAEPLTVTYQKGEYYVLDQTERKNISTIIFPLPNEFGKGILAAPTADGNVIYGPTAEPTVNGDTSVDAGGLDKIKKQLAVTYKTPDYRKSIRLYAGLRTICGMDFVIEQSKLKDGFSYLAGICSPGLTSAPAIAEYVVNELVAPFKALVPKKNCVTVMPKHKRLKELTAAEIKERVRADEAWGRVICRCESVTEAEIVAAIRSPLSAVTVDAVKRRVRAGMGRCQGGFCMPRVLEILARETGVPETEITKCGKGTEIVFPRG
ncbi:MAG: NAD(P)/FAD-dependent oxidoreductase [Clostridiaceae bacterium]|nr:NAD(P)/FAD-dependent oxidoreductase [Clostridiaceae bacterium]